MKRTLVPLLLLAAACESIDSKNVRTDGIYADLRAVADDTGTTRLEARLRTGGDSSNTFLDLSDGDLLNAYAGAETREMERHSLFSAVWYGATFDVADEDTPLRIELLREPLDQEEADCRGDSAPSSTVTLPAPVEITGPATGTTFSRANDELRIAWTASNSGSIRYVISGDCIRELRGSFNGDPGGTTIEAGRLEPVSTPASSGSCDVEVRLIRTRTGSVDPAYGEGGAFSAEQHRTLAINSIP